MSQPDSYKGTDEHSSSELFSVCQFFRDGSYEYVRRHVNAKQALEGAYHYTHSVGALAGITRRVIITDSGDSICFEWIYGQGVVFPKQEANPQKDYRK
jgi:hypothetical protein